MRLEIADTTRGESRARGPRGKKNLAYREGFRKKRKETASRRRIPHKERRQKKRGEIRKDIWEDVGQEWMD